MKKITFDPTFGKFMVNPSPDEIKNAILNKPQKEWNVSSGVSTITYEDGEKETELLIYVSVGCGFMLQHSSSEDGIEFTLSNNKPSSETVNVFIGGNPQSVRSNYLVSEEMAWKAVEYFMQTGERLNSLDWQRYETSEVEFAGTEMQAA